MLTKENLKKEVVMSEKSATNGLTFPNKKVDEKNKDWVIKPEPILHVDATPNEDYPLRILKAYRQNCNCKFVSSIDGSEEKLSLMLKTMNALNDQRAKILDRAIAKLEGKNNKERKNEKD